MEELASRKASHSPPVVVGSRGFVGRALTTRLSTSGESGVIGVCRGRATLPGEVSWGSTQCVEALEGADTMVWVAGGSDHGFPDRDWSAAASAEIDPLREALRHFRGVLVLLSSQAVYSGLVGSIPSETLHDVDMPYGKLKRLGESIAGEAFDAGRLSGLRVHRLMYAFGQGEAERRLIPRLARSAAHKAKVVIDGGGRSFLNPLPVEFVAEVLALSAVEAQQTGGQRVWNLNSPESWTVRQVVELLYPDPTLVRFRDSGEHWPVLFHGDVADVTAWLRHHGRQFPDVTASLTHYWTHIQGEERQHG